MTNINVPVGTKTRAVVPSDTAIIGCQRLYVGTTGDVYIKAEDDTEFTKFASVPAGTTLEVACQSVGESTTADDLVAIFV